MPAAFPLPPITTGLDSLPSDHPTPPRPPSPSPAMQTLRQLAARRRLRHRACRSPPLAAEPLLRPGDRVAIVGDSITEQKLYSKYMECYLLACSGVPDVKVLQFGWSGETAGGFANRVENDLAAFQPTVVTLCYGMNDGGYQPWRTEIGTTYEANMRNVPEEARCDSKVRTIVVGSPGAVDQRVLPARPDAGRATRRTRPTTTTSPICATSTRSWPRSTSSRSPTSMTRCIDTMKKAQAALGRNYDVCGGDGFHPGPQRPAHHGLRVSEGPAAATARSARSRSTSRTNKATAERGHKICRRTASEGARSKARAGRSASKATARPRAARAASLPSCRSMRISTA